MDARELDFAKDWPGQEFVDWRGGVVLPFRDIPWQEPGGGDVRLYDVRTIFPDREEWIATVPKNGYVVHHDAAAFRDEDRNFNGTSLDESLDRLKVIYDYHLQQGWNGIGYHFAIDSYGRLFMTGSPWTHRAHTKGWDAAANALLNHSKLGIVFMGNFADGVNADGWYVEALQDRPSELAVRALKCLLQTLTNALDRRMDLHPHKYWQSDTECPGTWTVRDSWASVTYEPQPPPPPPPSTGVPPEQCREWYERGVRDGQEVGDREGYMRGRRDLYQAILDAVRSQAPQ